MSLGTDARHAAKTGRITRIVLPVSGLLGLIALWWLVTVVFSIEDYKLPSPVDVAAAFSEFPGLLLEHSGITLLEAVEGFALSIVVGVPIALLIVSSTVLERTIYPLLVALNAFPKVAIAPLLVIWLGIDGIAPKVVMVFLVAFFPVVISTASGMKATPTELVELMRSLDCSRRQEFFKLRLLHALPQIFVGLKVAISLAVVGAVIAEFMPGSAAGLGFIIIQSGATVNTALAFAAMALLGVMSIALFYGLVHLERKLLPWAEEHR
nr:ABC transporter permease [Kibdelosporangium sp. MJ126-NF4]CEL18160.1 Hydroxymethylpyrimidine ABC transporter, transmembrane component [Kibdelosporangium sp. MJ126-NF4]CTQ90610.1 Hydroxymethylpyrimidine ABC transporter, transmembrane component [Kibdelosporangium sp. MJ126-NF4]